MLSSTPSYLSGKGSCHLQVIGMHFMNPPPIMRLVEIVRGADTSDASFSATKSLAERSLEEYILFWFELVSYIFVTCGCPLSLFLSLYTSISVFCILETCCCTRVYYISLKLVIYLCLWNFQVWQNSYLLSGLSWFHCKPNIDANDK